jgi:hypothetical protein
MDKKKQVAAIAAVMAYLESEMPAAGAELISIPPTLPSPWAQYGRQLQMTNRDLMQRRVIKR